MHKISGCFMTCSWRGRAGRSTPRLICTFVYFAVAIGLWGVASGVDCTYQSPNTRVRLKAIQVMTPIAKFLRAVGPAIASSSPTEAARAGLGAFVGLAVAGLFMLLPIGNANVGLFLIAPFGASAVLLFAVPNSPLAQPWSAIVGNSLAAVIGVAVCMTVADPTLRVALAVGLSIAAMVLCRAVHPPAGAVAMTAAMSPDMVAEIGFWFALTPVAVGTVLLVAIATLYARATGRHYPFRHFDDENAHGTRDPSALERLGLSEGELTAILERYRQSFNLGVEDLARLIAAAEMQAASHQSGPMVAGDVMSRDLVTVGPHVAAGAVADLFRDHNFTSLPVVGEDGAYLGIIFQMHLIALGRDASLRRNTLFSAAMSRVLGRSDSQAVLAHQLMAAGGPRATPQTSISALLALMSEGEVDAVPVLNDARLCGLVTRTDMIAAIARHSLHQQPDGAET